LNDGKHFRDKGGIGRRAEQLCGGTKIAIEQTTVELILQALFGSGAETAGGRKLCAPTPCLDQRLAVVRERLAMIVL
jgi:hypothetical protein